MLRAVLICLLMLAASPCGAQVIVDNNGPNADTLEFDTDTIPFHYPYFGPRIPPWFGIVGGYEGWNTHCWEAGVAFHLAEFHSDFKTGQMVGGMLTYKQSTSGRLKTVELEAGIYTPFSLGLGVNANFYEGSRTIGFRPFVGTSWWHLQVMAGYNFYSKRQSSIAELDHFTLKVRYVIPVARLYKKTTPNPGNNY